MLDDELLQCTGEGCRGRECRVCVCGCVSNGRIPPFHLSIFLPAEKESSPISCCRAGSRAQAQPRIMTCNFFKIPQMLQLLNGLRQKQSIGVCFLKQDTIKGAQDVSISQLHFISTSAITFQSDHKTRRSVNAFNLSNSFNC